jgi:hypothetical protein
MPTNIARTSNSSRRRGISSRSDIFARSASPQTSQYTTEDAMKAVAYATIGVSDMKRSATSSAAMTATKRSIRCVKISFRVMGRRSSSKYWCR